MGRVQLAINVTDVDEAIAFYSKLFSTEPAKRRPGYANFAIADPPLKLVLMQGTTGGTLNHLGVEVETTGEVAAAAQRLSDQGLETKAESGACCYAEQEKVWVRDPDGAPWEVYTVIADAETMSPAVTPAGVVTCCAGDSTDATDSAESSACC